jgi:hypothetical protein
MEKQRLFQPHRLHLWVVLMCLFSSSLQSATAPALPSNFRVTGSTSNSISLAWSVSTSGGVVDGFKIQRASTSTGTWSRIATLPSKARAYTNSSLSASTTYFYRIRSYNSSHHSALIGPISGSTKATVPTAPTNLLTSVVGPNSAALTWVDTSTNETGFKIFHSLTSTGIWTQVGLAPVDAQNFTVTSLAAQTKHYFRVRSYNSAGGSSSPISSVTLPSAAKVVWSDGFETGDTSKWYFPENGPHGSYGGGEFNNGDVDTLASNERPRTGNWSGKMTIKSFSGSPGTRMFRWLEPRQHREAYYSAWIYIPVNYTLTGDPATGKFWNLMQFKSRTQDNSRIDPVWALYVDKRSDGNLCLKAGWGWGGVQLAGPYQGNNVSGKWFFQEAANLPVGRWFHLEIFLRQSSAYDGRMTVWQDGVQIFDLNNIITSYKNCNYNNWCAANEWGVNLYSDGLSPVPATIYIDDVVIATGARVGPSRP